MFGSLKSLFSGAPASSQSQYGDDSLSSQELAQTGLLADVQALGPNMGKNLMVLIEKALAEGEPMDDKTMLMERVITLVASLPEGSKMRRKLSHKLIEGLYNSLPHPPTSYYGDQFQYRTFDGSYNNILSPDMGKAGTAYAKSVRSDKGLLGAKPDPGMLFDLLMAREDGKFVENPSGINSMLFYHASIIIHDVFRTNRKDSNISDTSSYLDLAPLYGSSAEDQIPIRTWKDGKLKADTFAEERLLGQPAGVCVMLVMYNRFHNYVADQLAAINDEGRFTLPNKSSETYEADLLKRDNAIFQTARLVVGGLYVNISLRDYIRGITNINHSSSTWTLDPRVDINAHVDGYEVKRGVGNQVSAEFNLLYRFHSAISQKDDKWTADFFKRVFDNKKPHEITIPDFVHGLRAWESTIPKDPAKRVFGGLTRDPKTGKFDDAALVGILKESIEDPAGSFGARNVPKYLRVIEILGIMQARKWQVASLNEFRAFFGLKKHDTFESINPDPYVADILRKLYSSPDMVELYPGLFVESAKKRMDPGSGFSAPYTVGRAVLSDAVTLVRTDRFNTTDYTNATLTAWGMAEVKQDYATLGGSSMYRLIQRSFPGWFKFNSVYVMQPMYTPKMNAEIFKELGTISSFCLDPPSPPKRMTILNTHSAISVLLADNKNFKVRYGESLPDLIFADFMLSGDGVGNAKNHSLMREGLVRACPKGPSIFESWFESTTKKIFARESYKLNKIFQVDITKDIARVVVIHMHSELLNLPLLSKGEKGEGLSEEDMYKHVSTLLQYVILDNDPAESWNLRKRARDGVTKLKSVVENRVRQTSRSGGLLGMYFGAPEASKGSLKEIGQNLTKKLLDKGYSVADTAVTLFTSAAGGVPNLPNSFIQTMDWFLTPGNEKHWDAVKKLAADDSRTARDQLQAYVLEAQRLSSGLGITRICNPESGEAAVLKNDQGVDVTISKGDLVICNCTAAFRDPVAFPQPNEVKLDRPIDSYPMWGMSSHWCIGREIAIVGITSMVRVCAQIKGLRRAPGAQGQLKWIPGPLGSRKYLNDDWSRFSPFATTWKVQFDDF